jgi:mannose/fructose/N-acetylgalactosamine-specific phosphotransferase system component IIB
VLWYKNEALQEKQKVLETGVEIEQVNIGYLCSRIDRDQATACVEVA